MNQELLHQASMLEQHSQETEKHLSFIIEQVQELGNLYDNLSFFGSGENKILASLGRGILIPGEKTSNNFLVEVGQGILVQKNPEHIKEVVKEQIKSLNESRRYLETQLEFYSQSLQDIVHKLEEQEK